MKKIVFTTTVSEARLIRKALSFFYISNTKGTAEYPEGISELCPERMEIFETTPKQMIRLDNFVGWLDREIENSKKPVITTKY